MEIKVIIPGRFIGMNEIISSCRRNPYYGARVKREGVDRKRNGNLGGMEKASFYITRQAKGTSFCNPVSITIAYYEPNAARDWDNVFAGGNKVILDSLQECGVIKNDDQAAVPKLFNHGFVDAHYPRVEIFVKEVCDAES